MILFLAAEENNGDASVQITEGAKHRTITTKGISKTSL
jgi:hypothetical protein